MSRKSSFSLPKKAVLGRGLESLFPSSLGGEILKEKSPVFFLDISRLRANPRQPRKNFDKQALWQLSESIKRHGLIQPVLVRQSGSQYEIIAGERRWRAAAMAGLHEIPVWLVKKKKEESVILALIENLQREGLNPIELANSYKKIMQEQNLTQEQVADRLSIARASLANQLRLLNLDPKVQNLLMEKKLSFSLAKVLLMEKNPATQRKLAEYFYLKKMGVQEAQKFLLRKKKQEKKSPQDQKISLSSQEMHLLKKIQDLHGVKSSLQLKKKGGELRLRFYSKEELNYLLGILCQNPES